VDAHVEKLIDMAVAEDLGSGDVTSLYFVPEKALAKAYVLVKQAGVIAGNDLVAGVFQKVDPTIQCKTLVKEGSLVEAGTRVMEISGNARSVLSGERVALNFMQRLSGIATKTASYAKLIEHTDAKLLDTRKTTPAWRLLEKQAVLLGGGKNHRMGLFDRAMVKDNHLVAQHDLHSLQACIRKLKQERPEVEIELEADTLEQVKAFLELDGVDYLLLDNMPIAMLAEAVAMRGNRPVALEASGGVTHDTIKEVAETGVDFISVGALTHSAMALDISLEFIPAKS
jgi:nicotinate-nucleotide pyrophosphorylase (carboxylating)